MENPSYVVLSHQMALHSQMDVIANNLANMNTTGFREEQLTFSELLGGKASNPGVRGTGARVSFVGLNGTVADTREGPFETTGNQLDLAIKGNGYFVVNTPDGQRYTRSGQFGLDTQGQIVTREGYPVLDGAGRALSVPTGATSLEVTPTGAVSTDKGVVGNLQLVKFDSDQVLQKVGTNLYQTDAQSQAVDGTTSVMQGMLEGSNVQPIVEMSKMIQVQRAYESAQQMLNNEHDRDLKAIETLTKTN
jgi:flagellar basal-body rod protein FlgF